MLLGPARLNRRIFWFNTRDTNSTTNLFLRTYAFEQSYFNVQNISTQSEKCLDNNHVFSTMFPWTSWFAYSKHVTWRQAKNIILTTNMFFESVAWTNIIFIFKATDVNEIQKNITLTMNAFYDPVPLNNLMFCSKHLMWMRSKNIACKCALDNSYFHIQNLWFECIKRGSTLTTNVFLGACPFKNSYVHVRNIWLESTL